VLLIKLISSFKAVLPSTVPLLCSSKPAVSHKQYTSFQYGSVEKVQPITSGLTGAFSLSKKD